MVTRGFIDYHKTLFRLLFCRDSRHIGLRGRLQLSLVVLSALLIFISFSLLASLDLLPSEKSSISYQLASELDSYEQRVHGYTGNIAGLGISLSRHISSELTNELKNRKATLAQASDNPDLLLALQKRVYSVLRHTLVAADCSGIFAILDATVNSSLPDANLSRSGVYLKIANISKNNAIDSEFVFVRGMHEIGTGNRHIFHNKWELEFSITQWNMYQELKDKSERDLTRCYMFTPRVHLQGTWETMMLLCVPILHENGEFMGVCGLEINSLYFKRRLSSHTQLLQLTGLLACRNDSQLLPGKGLESGTLEGYFAGLQPEAMNITPQGALQLYESSSGSFIGMHRDIALSPLDGENSWVTAVLIPEAGYSHSLRIQYIKVAIFFAGFLLASYLFCYRIGRMFIDPILDKIEAVTRGDSDCTELSEIDDLIAFLRREEQKTSRTSEQMEQLVSSFVQNIELLSKAERAVFDLYMEGFTAPDIADKLHISMNTVKSHNKRIYRKLNVSSRKELLFFAKVMQNEGRL